MFFRTINFYKYSESVTGVYIETVEVKLYRNGGEVEIRIKRDTKQFRFRVIRVPLLKNGDAEINKVFSLFNDMNKEEMLKIANEVLA